MTDDLRRDAAPIRCAFFDIGNVVLFFSHEKMCRQLASAYGCPPEEVRASLFASGLAAAYDRGQVSTEHVFTALGAALGRSVALSTARRAAAEIFSPNDDIVPIVDGLRQRGVKLVLLSNTCEVHSTYALEHYEILRRFDDRVLSHEVGSCKPEAAIFEVALQRAGCSAEESFFVDDIDEHVQAARRLGINALRFRDAAQLRGALDLP